MPNLTNLPMELLLMIEGFGSSEQDGRRTRSNRLKLLSSWTLVNRHFHNKLDTILWKVDQINGPVHWAARNNRIDILEKALKYKLNLGTARTGDPLCKYVAARKGHCAALTWLLDHGVPVDGDGCCTQERNTVDTEFSPLHAALQSEKQTTAIILLSRGAKRIDVYTLGWKRSALHFAGYKGLDEVIKYLVETKGVDVNETITSFDLHVNTYTLEELTGPVFRTPLLMAMYGSNQKVIHTLLSLGADINAELHPDLIPPLTFALQLGAFPHALLLLNAGAKASPRNVSELIPSPLMACVLCDHDRWKPNTLCNTVTRILIEKGADLNSLYDGETLLTAAIDNRCTTTLFFNLIKAGADVQKPRESDDKTPMEVIWSHIQLKRNSVFRKASLLVAAGARLNVQDLRDTIQICLDNIDEGYRSTLAIFFQFVARHNIHIQPIINACFEDNFKQRNYKVARLLVEHGITSARSKRLAFSRAQQIILKKQGLKRSEELILCLDLKLNKSQRESLIHDAFFRAGRAECDVLIRPDILSSLTQQFRPWLHIAASRGWNQLTERLHEGGMKIDALDDKFGTPLMRALEAGRTLTAQLLVRLGADPFYPRPNAKCRRLPNPSTEIISPFEFALRGKYLHKRHRNGKYYKGLHGMYLRLARKWWLESPPESRPTEDFYIPLVLTRGPISHVFMETLRRRTNSNSANLQDEDSQGCAQECMEREYKLDDELEFIRDGGLWGVTYSGSSADEEINDWDDWNERPVENQDTRDCVESDENSDGPSYEELSEHSEEDWY